MKKILVLLVIFLVVVAFIFRQGSTELENVQQMLKPTPLPAGEQELIGWFAAWDNDKASEALPPVMARFETFSPMLYRVMSDSSLGRHNIDNRDEILSIARENNVPIAPVITDEGDAKRIDRLLNDAEVQQQFIGDLITEAQNENFSGWSIDIEKVQSSDKEAFSNFIINLSEALHAEDLKLNVIAYGKDADETYDPALAHDYEVFGKYADQVQLMIYYYSNEYTDPGGQTPRDSYRSVLQFALDTIPQDKIVVGLSTHGNEWVEDREEVKGYTYPEVQERIRRYDAPVSYDARELSQVAWFEVDGKEHTLYFENADTIVKKMEIAREDFGINKFAFWRLSAEDPGLWERI